MANRCTRTWSPPWPAWPRHAKPHATSAGRTFRPVLQGIHPGHGGGYLRELAKDPPKNDFTVGIIDDVTHPSLAWDPDFRPDAAQGVTPASSTAWARTARCLPTRTPSRSSPRRPPTLGQGYFVYDSKKAGAMTISHLRFGPKPIDSTYLIGTGEANFVACHQPTFLDRYDMLDMARPAGSSCSTPRRRRTRSGTTCRARCRARSSTKDCASTRSTPTRSPRTPAWAGASIPSCRPASSPSPACCPATRPSPRSRSRRRRPTARKAAPAGSQLRRHRRHPGRPAPGARCRTRPAAPSSGRRPSRSGAPNSCDGSPPPSWPAAATCRCPCCPPTAPGPPRTTQYEKRNIAHEMPVWEVELCTHCGKCPLVCPHAAIRSKVFPDGLTAEAPASFLHVQIKGKDFPAGLHISYQVAPEDCTGCGLCVEVCPSATARTPTARR